MSDIVVIGGGLAGGAAACGLARAGRQVTVLERDRAPADKICGEFLSVEAQHALAAIGLDIAALGGHPISRLRLIRGAEMAEAALPFEALGLTRRRLDAALLDHAGRLGVTVRRGTAVRDVTATGKLRLELADRSVLSPELALLATGKHEVRGAHRATGPVEDLIGFKMYFRLTPVQQATLAGHIELYLFASGYAGLQLVEAGVANLTLLVDRRHFRALGGQWDRLLASLRAASPILQARLGEAEPLLAQPLTIFRVPYGFIHRPNPGDPANLFRLGDQIGVIPSFTGDGMAIALHSAAIAVRTIEAGGTASAHHARVRRDLRGQIFRATALYRAMRQPRAQPLLFAATQRFPFLLRQAARWTRVS